MTHWQCSQGYQLGGSSQIYYSVPVLRQFRVSGLLIIMIVLQTRRIAIYIYSSEMKALFTISVCGQSDAGTHRIYIIYVLISRARDYDHRVVYPDGRNLKLS